MAAVHAIVRRLRIVPHRHTMAEAKVRPRTVAEAECLRIIPRLRPITAEVEHRRITVAVVAETTPAVGAVRPEDTVPREATLDTGKNIPAHRRTPPEIGRRFHCSTGQPSGAWKQSQGNVSLIASDVGPPGCPFVTLSISREFCKIRK